MQKIIAANWKMYKIRVEAAQTARELAEALADGTPHDRLVLVFPPFTDITAVAEAFTGKKNLAVGGQNFYPAEQGAFTGCVIRARHGFWPVIPNAAMSLVKAMSWWPARRLLP